MQFVKQYWWAFFLLAIGGLAYYNRHRFFAPSPIKEENPDKGTDTTTTTTTTTTNSTVDQNKILKLTSPEPMKGAEILELQKRLNAELAFLKANAEVVSPNLLIPAGIKSLAALVEDGQFGAKTETRLKEFTGEKEITLAQLKRTLQHLKPEVVRAVLTAAANRFQTSK